jgi:hypothetical protein
MLFRVAATSNGAFGYACEHNMGAQVTTVACKVSNTRYLSILFSLRADTGNQHVQIIVEPD